MKLEDLLVEQIRRDIANRQAQVDAGDEVLTGILQNPPEDVVLGRLESSGVPHSFIATFRLADRHNFVIQFNMATKSWKMGEWQSIYHEDFWTDNYFLDALRYSLERNNTLGVYGLR